MLRTSNALLSGRGRLISRACPTARIFLACCAPCGRAAKEPPWTPRWRRGGEEEGFLAKVVACKSCAFPLCATFQRIPAVLPRHLHPSHCMTFSLRLCTVEPGCIRMVMMPFDSSGMPRDSLVCQSISLNLYTKSFTHSQVTAFIHSLCRLRDCAGRWTMVVGAHWNPPC